jgi:hypothetical protein
MFSGKLGRPIAALEALCLVAFILLAGPPSFTNASKPPRGISSPLIALEMAQSVPEVDYILGDAPSPDREVMRIKVYIDMVFTASLTALYLTLGWLLMRHGGIARVLAPAAMVCALGMATFAGFQKFAILRLLDSTLVETAPPALSALRSAGAAMWSLSGFTLALLSGMLLGTRNSLSRAAGAVVLLTAAMELYGLRDNRFLVWQVYPALAGLAVVMAMTWLSVSSKPRAKAPGI